MSAKNESASMQTQRGTFYDNVGDFFFLLLFSISNYLEFPSLFYFPFSFLSSSLFLTSNYYLSISLSLFFSVPIESLSLPHCLSHVRFAFANPNSSFRFPLFCCLFCPLEYPLSFSALFASPLFPILFVAILPRTANAYFGVRPASFYIVIRVVFRCQYHGCRVACCQSRRARLDCCTRRKCRACVGREPSRLGPQVGRGRYGECRTREHVWLVSGWLEWKQRSNRRCLWQPSRVRCRPRRVECVVVVAVVSALCVVLVLTFHTCTILLYSQPRRNRQG